VHWPLGKRLIHSRNAAALDLLSGNDVHVRLLYL
jgi:hypothetical protein